MKAPQGRPSLSSSLGRMPVGRIALVVRGDRSAPIADKMSDRLTPVVEALARVDLVAEIAIFSEAAADEVRSQLVGVDGALVWVDPVSGRDDRTTLDAMLRDIASAGVWVSAHPNVILKMGTKEVVYRTRELGWGSDTDLYRTIAEFKERFPVILRRGAARVLKQYRGNGGIGVQKVEMLADDLVRVQSARQRDEATEDVPLREFMQRCERYFAYSDGAGRLIDQPFQNRITEGMIRCYLVKDEVVGFARQFPHEGSSTELRRVFGLPSQKTMFGPNEPDLRVLRRKLESEWVPEMQRLVEVDQTALPALWEADFIFGSKDDSGEDTYVLCEINVSAVAPFPPEALPKLARATLAAVRDAKRSPVE